MAFRGQETVGVISGMFETHAGNISLDKSRLKALFVFARELGKCSR